MLSVAANYDAARSAFRAAAHKRRAELFSVAHPRLRDATGQSLSVDVALLGTGSADTLFIIVSGTHGIEGYCGSAIQCRLLADDATALLPKGLRLCMVHAINPYGFEHDSRTDEDNVDLNRNFIAHNVTGAHNADYAALHDLLFDWDSKTPLASDLRLQAYLHERGLGAFLGALTAGQSTHRQGLFFRGSAPSWSNQVWRQILRDQAADVRRLVLVDLHSGLGASGTAELILLAGDLTEARTLFGSAVKDLKAGQSTASDRIEGTLVGSATEETHASVAGIALELGTVPLLDMIDCLRAEAWLRQQNSVAAETAASIRRASRRCFCGDGPWQASSWRHAHRVVANVLAACSPAR